MNFVRSLATRATAAAIMGYAALTCSSLFAADGTPPSFEDIKSGIDSDKLYDVTDLATGAYTSAAEVVGICAVFIVLAACFGLGIAWVLKVLRQAKKN